MVNETMLCTARRTSGMHLDSLLRGDQHRDADDRLCEYSIVTPGPG